MKKTILLLSSLLLAVAAPSSVAAAPSAMVEIVDFDADEPTISVQGMTVRVTGASGMTLSVYNVAGVCVMQRKVEGDDKSFELNLPKGCYILKVGKVVRKVSIK